MEKQKKPDLKTLTNYQERIKTTIETIIDCIKGNNNLETDLHKCMYKLSYICENYITDMEILLNQYNYSEINLQKVQSKIRNYKNIAVSEIETVISKWYETYIVANGIYAAEYLSDSFQQN